MLQGAAQGMDGVFPLEATAGIIESCDCFHHLLLNNAQFSTQMRAAENALHLQLDEQRPKAKSNRS